MSEPSSPFRSDLGLFSLSCDLPFEEEGDGDGDDDDGRGDSGGGARALFSHLPLFLAHQLSQPTVM